MMALTKAATTICIEKGINSKRSDKLTSACWKVVSNSRRVWAAFWDSAENVATEYGTTRVLPARAAIQFAN
jgi:hypothetical protein